MKISLIILLLFISDTIIGQTLTAIHIIPNNNITVGINTQFKLKAIGIYNNNTTQDVSTQVTWISSNAMNASISNASGSQGIITGQQAGNTTITAQLNNITGILPINVAADADGDLVTETMDNCKYVYNQQQLDQDSDAVGDACDCVPNMSMPNQSSCTSVNIFPFPGNPFSLGDNVTFYTVVTAVNTLDPLPNYQWTKNSLSVGTNSPTYTDNSLTNGDVIQCTISSGTHCVVGGTALSNTITMINTLTLGSVGIGTSNPITKLDVDGGIRTKFSGTFVSSNLTAGVQTVVPITIPTLPNGWDFKNTVVLVSNADGAIGTILQSNLSSITNINVTYLPTTSGVVRFNWIVFKI